MYSDAVNLIYRNDYSVLLYIVFTSGGFRLSVDVWDGPLLMPLVMHGHTLTSKIHLTDVLRAIKRHAFVVSE